MYFTDSSHIWHVAKAGNDGNSGHAAQYPVNLANDAKLTFASAYAAASAGDTIIVGLGTYAENMNLTKSVNVIGTHPALCKFDDVIIAAAGCYMENITVDGSGGDAFTMNADDVILYRCRAITTGIDGLIFGSNAKRCKFVECYFKSGYDGLQLKHAEDILIDRCICESTGENGSVVEARGLSTEKCKRVIIKDSQFIATTTQGVDVIAANVEGQASFYNCSFRATASVRTGTKRVVGLEVAGDTSFAADVLCSNCNFQVDKGSPNYALFASGYGGLQAVNCTGVFEKPPVFGLETVSSSCTAQVSGQEKNQFKDSSTAGLGDDKFIGYYLTWTSGNNTGESKYITDFVSAEGKFVFGSNFTSDIELGDEYTAVFYSYTAYADNDNDGYARAAKVKARYGTTGDSVERLDEESAIAAASAVKLDKAAKVLVNKAVQSKITGAVDYYDDDGQTVFLTHTPQDDSSQITRTPG